MSDVLERALSAITEPDAAAGAEVQRRLDEKTKPRGSLGGLERLAVRIAGIQRTATPALGTPVVVVCAADHGVAAEGVSAYPSSVTAQMVANYASGGAAVSVLARRAGAQLVVVDCGVAEPLPVPGVLDRRLGPGTGLDDEGLARKRDVVTRALELNQPGAHDPLGALAAVGGFELGVLAGLALGAAGRGVPVLVDGYPASSAVLVAAALAPALPASLIAAHRSSEPGHRIVLDKLGLQPLLDLELRLGEGSGAALALPLLGAALAILDEMATFASAGVDDSGA